MPIRVTRSVIPSLFTCMNLFCGFFAIVKTTQEDYLFAAWLIVLAGIFDALDGVMARLTNSSSEFGVELDSLADVISFGTAPSFMLYWGFFQQWDSNLGVLIAALPAICGALRLARFNVMLVGFDKNYFMGLPIPSAALVLISYLVFYHLPPDSPIPVDIRSAIMVILTVAVSLLMVSTIRYDTLPKPSAKSIKRNPLKFAILLLGVVAIVLGGSAAIFPLMLVYLVYGIVRQIVAIVRDRRASDDDDDTMEATETTPFDI